MADINLLGYKLTQVDMESNLTNSCNLPIKNRFEFDAQYSKDKKYILTRLTEYLEAEGNYDGFHIIATVEGTFEAQEVGLMDEEEMKEIHIQCYNELFPYASQIVTQIGINAGFNGLMLKRTPLDAGNVMLGKENEEEKEKKIINLC